MPLNPVEVFHQYSDAWNRHDAPAIVATFADKGTYSDPVTYGPLTGAAIGAYAESLWAAFPDLSFEMMNVMENGGDLLSAEWLMRGTNTGSLNGLPPTGNSISQSGADFVRMKAGKICSVQGYFDPGVVPRSLGLDVIVQPKKLGPWEFGISARVSSGSKDTPGAFSITFFDVRSEEEKQHIRESSRKIAEDMLSMPGFISLVTATVGSRMMTITAWDSAESSAPLMKTGEHREAVASYFRSEMGGSGGMTGIWIPGRLNPRRVRCNACSKMAASNASGDKCSCGTILPDPLAYW